jgi:hypothetical protein
MLGEWASHADLHGKNAVGLMVRRERVQLLETIERSQPVRLVACRESDFEAELIQPMLPAFMGVGEIAAELEVSKQRASELSRDSRFPQPVADLAAGPVWLASSVRSFVKNWSRQSGRPRRS